MKHLDANTLVAYVDGELDLEAAGVVESRLAQDADARRLAGVLRESALMVRAAHNHVLHEAVPDRLVDLFDMADPDDDEVGDGVPQHLVNMILNAPENDSATVVTGGGKARVESSVIPLSRRRSVAAMASAAVVAAVMIGGGFLFGQQSRMAGLIEEAGLRPQAAAVAAIDDPWREAAFQEALETRKSSVAVVWNNPESGVSGAIIPVKTFRRDDGTFCRAFQSVEATGGAKQPNLGVACRQPGREGKWIKTVEAIASADGNANLKF